MSREQGAALIVGISGGIGSALARLWHTEQTYSRVLGTSRAPGLRDGNDADVLTLDLQDESSINGFTERLQSRLGNQALRTVCICSGALHGPGVRPERRMADTDPDALRTLLDVNAIGPLLLLRQVASVLPRQGTTRILVLSARVGSIADNRLGGWLSYRVSKAALNQGIKTYAVELQRTHPGCVVTLYHPGTVDTALSAPFQKNVPKSKLFSAAFAAKCLSDVLHRQETPRSHLFVDWADKAVAF